jgi:hypothetical protein
MERFVDITFECVPLRTITRRDIPIDASPAYRAQCERILAALDTHGSFNSYYLLRAQCKYRLTNDETVGMLQFKFEGTVMTDPTDARTDRVDLEITLVRETCDWLTEPIVAWFRESVQRAVRVEFDRYIAAGDLQQTIARLEKIQSQVDQQGGFVGMGL